MTIVGVDIGGTFTDLIAVDPESGRINVGKVPSTPGDPSKGLMSGLETSGVRPADISVLVHGTTVATNAVLERKGARCGLLTTEGFRDVLELGWRDRPRLWGLEGEYDPIIPRDRAYGILERVSSRGELLQDVSEEEIREAGRSLLAQNVEAVVISFLHSYANSHNEERAEEILREFWPNNYIVRSSAVLPEFREFERTSTSALVAYTQPIIASYLEQLETSLQQDGFERDLWIMQSNGGVASASVTKERSAHTILSGPAAGATAASYIASITGYENVISCDMGGTSFDVALLPGGDPVMTQDTDLDYQLPIRVPMIDITAIGAGGGSIARVDEGGILHTGPESAGAEPGPICYGRGGTEVTITDAQLVLNRINPENPIGSELNLDVRQTRDLLKRDIADPLGLSVDEAARAVIDVGVNKMTGKIRELSVGRGYDPRDFTLVTFGGAGPLHAGDLIQNSDVPRAIVPYYPGILSAMGCVFANARHDHVESVNRRLDELDLETFHQTIDELERKGRGLLSHGEKNAGSRYEASVRTLYQSDMKYLGQTHTVQVPFPSAEPTREELQEQFRKTYLETYSEEVDKPILLDNVQVSVIEVTEDMDLKQFVREPGKELSKAQTDQREVFFGGEWVECTIYDRTRIPLESSFEGPAILEQPDTTTVINPGLRCRIDPYGNAIIEE